VSTFAQGLAWVLVLMIVQQLAARNRSLSRFFQVVVCCAAPLLFAFLLYGTDPALMGGERNERRTDFQHSGSVFVTFLGLQKPLQDAFRIGGQEGDFLIDRVPGEVATIGVDGTLHVRTIGTRGDYFSATRGNLEDLVEHATLPTWRLPPGARVCFGRNGAEQCDSNLSWIWTVGEDGDLAILTGAEAAQAQPACALKQFTNAFGAQSLFRRISTARDRVYPLDIYGRPQCAGPAVELDAISTLRQTFLHFDARGRLYISQLPIGTRDYALIVEGGERIAPAQVDPSASADFRLTVFRLQTSSPLPKLEHRQGYLRSTVVAETGRSRLLKITGMDVQFPPVMERTAQREALRILPIQPSVAEIPPSMTCRHSTIVNLLGARERARSPLTEVIDFETSIRVPFLADMGRIGANGAAFEIQRSVLDAVPGWQAHGCRSFSRANISLSGAIGLIDRVEGSDVLSLGSPSQGMLLLAAAEYGVPGAWILALLLSVSILRACCRWSTWEHVSHAALISAVMIVVDTLLVIRLITAIQEVAVRPELSVDVPGALLALAMLPLIFDLAVGVLNQLAPRARRLAAVGYRRSWRSGASSFQLWACVLFVPLLHLGLVMAGIQEQIAGVRLTAVLVPTYVVLFAILVAASCAPRPASSLQRHPWVGVLTCGAIAVLAFVLARDTGAIITLLGVTLALTLMVTAAHRLPGRPMSSTRVLLAHSAVVFVALLISASMLLYVAGHDLSDVSLLQEHPALPTIAVTAVLIGIISAWRWQRTRAWLFAAPGAVVVLILLAISTAHFDQASEDCTDSDVRQLADCLDRQSMDTNRLRLSYLLYPQLARLNLTGEARSMNSVFDELRWLITQVDGQGFMSGPPRVGLDAPDNAVASHLIGPQGRASAILLCALLALPLLLLIGSAYHRRLGLQRPLAWLAYACLAFTSVYMILGNLLIVPFTGRNVYLTNPLSGTDLLEGGLLIALTLVPLASVRRRQGHEE
jgi:hypothetical protein